MKSEFGTFDLLSISAGFSIPTPVENVTEAVFDEMFNLNAKGPLFAVQKLLPLINKGGSIVLTTSVANVKGLPGQATYGAAKAAAAILRSDASHRAASSRNRVNAVTPVPSTHRSLARCFADKNAVAHVKRHMTGIIPMKRFGRRTKSRRPSLSSGLTRPSQTDTSFQSIGGWSQL